LPQINVSAETRTWFQGGRFWLCSSPPGSGSSAERRSAQTSSGGSSYEAESFPDAAATFGLLASAMGVVGTWLAFAVRKTNEGLPFALALCGLGVLLVVMFASSLPRELFGG